MAKLARPIFVDGNAVAQFVGVQPEAFIRAFLDRLIPDPSDIEHRVARAALARGQYDIAEDSLKNAVALNPANDGARLDMVSVLLARGEVHGARTYFGALSSKAWQQSVYQGVRARLAAAEATLALPSAEILARRIRRDANDLQSRLQLAELQIAGREFAPALDQLLEILRRDREFRGDLARLKILEVFELAADHPELVSEYRNRLSSVLF